MEGLDDLLSLLTRVKKKGWDDAFPDNLYDNHSQQANLKRHPAYSGHLLTYLRAIEEAKACVKALNFAQSRLGKRLRCLRRLSEPLVLEDGIKRLPDDVLAIIFEEACHFNADDAYEFAVRASHVSRRFRSVALATPSLWTTISESYREIQIREYISRSGRLDLDIKLLLGSTSEIQSFLNVLKDTSHRWSSLDLINDDVENFMMELGIKNLPRLRHLTYISPVELSTDTVSMPNLSQVVGWGWPPDGTCLLSQLTHVEFCILDSDGLFEDLATTLLSMKNLQDLSFRLEDCTGAFISPVDNATYPKPHSVQIDRLAICIIGGMHEYSAVFFHAVMHLRPSTLELSIDSIRPEAFLVNSEGELFPFGSAIKLKIPHAFDVMDTLVEILQNCDIVKAVHFDTPNAYGLSASHQHELDTNDWQRIRSLHHLRFMNCDEFDESEIHSFTTDLLQTEGESGIQSLEIISCKMISEEFLLGLHDEVGDRLKWTL